MKNKSRINDLDDLDNELARLHSRIRANKAAINQQWGTTKENFGKLSWNSLKAAFGFRANKSSSSPSAELTSTILNLLLKWIGKRK